LPSYKLAGEGPGPADKMNRAGPSILRFWRFRSPVLKEEPGGKSDAKEDSYEGNMSGVLLFVS